MTDSNGSGPVLVTGGHGFLGSHLVERLLAEGRRVRCLLRPSRDAAVFGERDVEIARGDLRDERGLAEAADGVSCVYHVAGLVAARNLAGFRAVNVEGTRRLAAAVARAAPDCRRIVLVSSQAAAGPSRDGRPVTEADRPRPVSAYGRSKLEAEAALAAASGPVPWTVVRPPAIYGPRDEAILPFFQLAALHLAPGLEGRGRRFNLLHARDVVDGLVRAARAPGAVGRTYFLADARGPGYDEIAATLGRVYGTRPRRIPIPDVALEWLGALVEEAGRLAGVVPVFGREKATELKQRWWLCSAARARDELGWRPAIPLAEGMAETARWYREAGKVKALAWGRASV